VDPLGALQALIAVVLYPGGAYLAAVSLGVASAAGIRLRGRPTPQEAAGMFAATLAAALAPMPGAVAMTLPPPPAFGVPANLAVALLVEAAAVTLVIEWRWTATRVVVALAPLVPLCGLAAAATTLSIPVLVSLPGVSLEPARALVAGALVTAAAPLLRPSGVGDAGRIAVLASIEILAASMALWPAFSALGAPSGAAVVAGAGLLAGLACRLLRRMPAAATGLSILAVAQSAGALAALVGARF
jgi:hypothetical protein